MTMVNSGLKELNVIGGKRVNTSKNSSAADPDNNLTGFQQCALSSFPFSQFNGRDLISLNISSQKDSQDYVYLSTIVLSV